MKKKKKNIPSKNEINNAMILLGISPLDNEESLLKIYRSALKKTHPDKGGSEDDVIKVIESYRVLKTYFKNRENEKTEKSNKDKDKLNINKQQNNDKTANKYLDEYLSIYKVLIKKYSRKLSQKKFLLSSYEASENILNNLLRLNNDYYGHCKEYWEYKSCTTFLQNLVKYHNLPLEAKIVNLKTKQNYFLYRKILRNISNLMEESLFSYINFHTNNTLWQQYFKETLENLEELNKKDSDKTYSILNFIPDYLNEMKIIIGILASHKAILPINDYLQI